MNELNQLTVTISVTFVDGDAEKQEPLVSSRVVMNGAEVEAPLVLVVGEKPIPLVVDQNIKTHRTALTFARALTSVGMQFGDNVLQMLEAARASSGAGAGEDKGGPQ